MYRLLDAIDASDDAPNCKEEVCEYCIAYLTMLGQQPLVKHGVSASTNHRPPSSIVCRLSFPLLQCRDAKTVVRTWNWGRKKWRSVEQKPAYGATFFCSVCIAIGMSKSSMIEAKIARITAISFGLLWIVMLGLTMLSER